MKGTTMTTRLSLVSGVDFVCVATSDLTAAMDFYGNVLGLPRSSVWQRPGQEPIGAEFETGSLTLALLASAKVGLEFRPNNHPIALHVDDVEAARNDLESRGIAFTAPTLDSGVCHQAFFKDPDGNALALHHRYAPRAS
jgi:predicted enzyme related to lactoylglutathione lyase